MARRVEEITLCLVFSISGFLKQTSGAFAIFCWVDSGFLETPRAGKDFLVLRRSSGFSTFYSRRFSGVFFYESWLALFAAPYFLNRK
jgi:hypothetical protein